MLSTQTQTNISQQFFLQLFTTFQVFRYTSVRCMLAKWTERNL